MMKRPAATSSSPAKTPTSSHKARKVVKVDPVEKKCQEVSAGLKKITGLPEAVGTLLGDVIPLSLAICQEERHPYQQGMVDVVAKELAKHEEALAGGVTEAENDLVKLAKDREAKEAGQTELEAKLKAEQGEVHVKSSALADAALAFRAAKEGLAEAEAKQKAGDKEFDEVVGKHEALGRIISEVLEPLKEGTVEKEKAVQEAAGLVPSLQCFFHVEESLVPAIPAVLSKEPSARGAFDAMAASQLEEQARKALQGFAATVQGGEAAKTGRTAATEEARERLTAARAAQRAGAAAFMAAKAQEARAEAAVNDAKDALRALSTEKKAKMRAADKARDAVKAFREGPLVAFKELSTRSSQPEEGTPAAEEAETPAGGQAEAMAEEAQPTADEAMGAEAEAEEATAEAATDE